MEMMNINDDVSVGAQPTEEQLDQLARQGVKTVINFRTEGEEEQPLSPTVEGEKVRSLGMEYLHVPVSTKAMGPEVVDNFRAKYANLAKPIYAHCKSGKRAGAMVMMHLATEHGMSGKETLEQAEQMGFKCDQPEFKEFVEGYVDTHSKRAK